MRAYLVRHGIALDIGEKGVTTDAERPLSADGRQKTAQVGKGLAHLDCRPNRILTSPLQRAAQTAEILARELRTAANAVESSELLSPGATPEATVRWLAAQTDAEIMLVGHVPDMPHLASLLVAGHTHAGFEFKKAGACCLTWDGAARPGAAHIEWLLQPTHIRAIGGAT
jgi:phosphohistidine phosphatase